MARFENSPPVADISAALLDAPVTLRLGLAVRDERLRQRAAVKLATVIVERLTGSQHDNADQLTLSL